MKTKYALISVFHKDGVVEFAKKLVALGWKIISSSNTAKAIKEGGLEVLDVSDIIQAATKKMIINIISELKSLNVITFNTNDLTLDNVIDQIMKRLNIGTPILDHRVATLYSYVHAAILARRNELADIDELKKLGVDPIDLVCVDFYDLSNEIYKPDVTEEQVIKLTDIGGPTLVSGAAKNRLIVICDPSDREPSIKYIEDGEKDGKFLDYLVAKAHKVVSEYRLLSAIFHSKGMYTGFIGTKVTDLKYGENPQQLPSALYTLNSSDPLALDKFNLVEGSPCGYVNYTDIDRLLQTMCHVAAGFQRNFGYVPLIAVGVKHGNPCGAAVGDNASDVITKMISGDPLAIFGGAIITNFSITAEEAWVFASSTQQKPKFDVVVAPSITPEAVKVLQRKEGRCHMLENPALFSLSLDTATCYRQVRGGFLLQPNYTYVLDLSDCEVCNDSVGENYKKDIILAWAIGSTSNSNTITIVKDGYLIGNGVGQMDRVAAAELAITKVNRAKHVTAGAVAYSDSFFPFTDGPESLIKAGVKVILSSSGSVKDNVVKNFCADNDVALYLIPDKVGRGFYKH